MPGVSRIDMCLRSSALKLVERSFVKKPLPNISRPYKRVVCGLMANKFTRYLQRIGLVGNESWSFDSHGLIGVLHVRENIGRRFGSDFRARIASAQKVL